MMMCASEKNQKTTLSVGLLDVRVAKLLIGKEIIALTAERR